jgi:hypothetical protein
LGGHPALITTKNLKNEGYKMPLQRHQRAATVVWNVIVSRGASHFLLKEWRGLGSDMGALTVPDET